MILLGNTYPLSLVRRPVLIEIATLQELVQTVKEEGFTSYWGHDNTCRAAESVLGFNPAPTSQRPAIVLNQELLPTLFGRSYQQIWILSPETPHGMRPAVGTELEPHEIASWTVLKLSFLGATERQNSRSFP